MAAAISFLTMGLIGKNNTLQSQKNVFRIMFCLQRVVYAGMNTKDQRENIMWGRNYNIHITCEDSWWAFAVLIYFIFIIQKFTVRNQGFIERPKR